MFLWTRGAGISQSQINTVRNQVLSGGVSDEMTRAMRHVVSIYYTIHPHLRLVIDTYTVHLYIASLASSYDETKGRVTWIKSVGQFHPHNAFSAHPGAVVQLHTIHTERVLAFALTFKIKLVIIQ